MLEINQQFLHFFTISQAQVDAFAASSGDNNPIHLDASFAATTNFKKPIIHGIFSASIFSKYFGTIYPGQGTIYLKQSLEFLRPMFVDTDYQAVMTVKEINAAKNIATFECQIIDSITKKITIKGEASVMNKEKIN